MRATKALLAVVIATSLGFAVGYAMLSRLLERQKAEWASRQAAWQTQKEELETALASARNSSPVMPAPALPGRIVQVTNRVSAAEILERLKTLRAGTNSSRGVRVVLHQFESLLELGPAALPAVRQFLAQNLDIDYDAGSWRGFRGGEIPTEFSVPPSLRLGLFEVVKNIGGDGGEQLLAEVLKTTGRGVEVAYLAYALQEIAPNKYRDEALAAAHDLLARPATTGAAGPLDRFDRDYLYGVLNFFSDGSYVQTAQAQMIQADGRVDAIAVRYLQQTLGEQFLPLAARAWQDQRVPADQKEPLARVALNYVGISEQADQLYQVAINDANLPPDHRKNLIEDLNETGFADPRHLTQADLPLIEKRIGLIEKLGPNSMDQVNADAFKEAYKDLQGMQNSLVPKAAPAK